MNNYKKKKQGIALIELVIVLGVVGFISAAIWAAATKVRGNENINDSVQILLDISSRVRSIYTGFPNANVPKNVAIQITNDFYPENIINKNRSDTVNNWGGTYFVRFDSTPPYRGFSIEVTIPNNVPKDISRDACMGLLTRNKGFATNYSLGTSGTLPTGTVKSEPAQGMGPALTFINVGGWQDTTTDNTVNIINKMGSKACSGVAFYYRF